MGSQAAGSFQPSGRIDRPNHSDDSRRLMVTRGRGPNLVATSCATAAPAAANAAVAKSDTANTDGRSPEPAKYTFASASEAIPRSGDIVVKNWRVWDSSSDEYWARA